MLDLKLRPNVLSGPLIAAGSSALWGIQTEAIRGALSAAAACISGQSISVAPWKTNCMLSNG
jgi:hypothetical protein